MKTFNKNEDTLLNQLAVDYANGNAEAGEQYGELMQAKMKSYAKNKFAGDMSKEDLTAEFLLIAVEMAFTYAERYVGKSNILPLVYTSCDNRLIDLGRGSKAQKRARTIQVGDESYNREISLQTQVGEDGDSTMADKVASSDKSVEDQVIEKMNVSTVNEVVKSFSKNTKGRNSKIVPLLYKANKDGWTNEELNSEISKVLSEESGKQPNNDAIRQAKARALKALRKTIESGNIVIANQLEWEL